MADLYDLLEDLRKVRSGMDNPSARMRVPMVRSLLDALIEKYEAVEFVAPPKTRVRRGASATSVQGAEDVSVRVGPQARTLLQEFARHEEGLTNYEAADACDLLSTMYWARCRDLVRQEMLVPAVSSRGERVSRVNPTSGSRQEVRKITAKGRAWLRQNPPN